jgi:hypothetical protein
MFFNSEVGLDETDDVLRVRGRVLEGNRLQIVVSAGNGLPSEAWNGKTDLISQEIAVDPSSLVIDGLAPHPRLSNLHVGQEWTIQSLRTFSPNSPVRRTRAKVEKQELVAWDREMETMHVVTMEDMLPQGLTAAQQTKVRLWVRSDGSVVRQQLEFAGLVIEFIRLPDSLSWDEDP